MEVNTTPWSNGRFMQDSIAVISNWFVRLERDYNYHHVKQKFLEYLLLRIHLSGIKVNWCRTGFAQSLSRSESISAIIIESCGITKIFDRPIIPFSLSSSFGSFRSAHIHTNDLYSPNIIIQSQRLYNLCDTITSLQIPSSHISAMSRSVISAVFQLIRGYRSPLLCLPGDRWG